MEKIEIYNLQAAELPSNRLLDGIDSRSWQEGLDAFLYFLLDDNACRKANETTTSKGLVVVATINSNHQIRFWTLTRCVRGFYTVFVNTDLADLTDAMRWRETKTLINTLWANSHASSL